MEIRKVPKSLFVLLVGGLLAFGALVMLVRMPKHAHTDNEASGSVDQPVSAPLTLTKSSVEERKNAKGPLNDGVCKSSTCLKTAYTLLESMNSSVDPCVDFYEYACGGWIAKNPIPPSVSKWSPFGVLDMQSNNVVQSILKEPPRSGDPEPLKQAKDFFKACSNVGELDRVGLKPLIQLLSGYGGWPILAEPGRWNPSAFDWMKSTADLKRMFGTSAIFDVQVNQHVSNTAYSTVHLQQPSLFMSRPYLLDQKRYQNYLTAYRDLIVNIVREIKSSPVLKQAVNGNPSANFDLKYIGEKAVDVIIFESRIAQLTQDGVTVQYGLRNSTSTLSLHYLQTIFNNYTNGNATNKWDIKKLLDYTFATSGVKIPSGQLVSMSDTNYMGNIFDLISTTPTETLANYLHFRMLGWVVSGTTSKMRDHIHKYHKIVYGITAPSSREYVCAASTEEKFGLALAQPYLKKVKADDTVIQQVGVIMEQVRSSFSSLLDSAKWMNASVKSNLKRKAKLITPCIGYASWMSPDGNSFDQDTYQQHLKKQYDGLSIGSGGYLQKLWNVRSWLTDTKLKILKDRFVPGCKWTTFPGQIGAFYDIRRQAVNIPLGLLQPPFFYNGTPLAINYGGLGSIIGHEFTHGFTVQGWTETEYGGFSRLSQCFVDQYNRFKVPEADMLYINGALTFDENFPDNGGLLEAFKTFKTYAPKIEQTLPGLEPFSKDQQFFLGFANIWCSSSRKEGLIDQVLQDHHTPNRYRVIGTLQNSQEFSEAWKCPVGSPMNPQRYKKCSAFQTP